MNVSADQPTVPHAVLTPTSPSRQLLGHLRAELLRHPPFSHMALAHVDRFVAAAEQAYFAPGEVVLSPGSGVVTHLYCLRQGSISGQRGMAEAAGGIQYEAGDMFPVGALMGRRAVTATYTAIDDAFCWVVPADTVRQLAQESAPLADHLNQRVTQFLALSRRALQVAYSSQTLAEQSMEAALDSLPRKAPVCVSPDTPIQEALGLMQARHVGSILVTEADGVPLGILTRHDVVGRITLPQRPLHMPIAEVMSAPVHCLEGSATVQEAALLMSRHGVRHVPVTEQGRLVSVVSERDLFAMQRLSLKQVSTALRAAEDVDTLRLVAQDIRRFARNLLGQGVAARQLTELISHLNDVLVQRLVQLMASAHGLDLQAACWLAFGSEGRGEQTIATDQDNGLIFLSEDPAADRPRWLAFALAVNQALDQCGYPLCKGQIMASNPECCLTPQEWAERFTQWMAQGAPEDLLKASIYFDFRALVGHTALADPLRQLVCAQAARLPRFMKQMALNALRSRAPLNWLGGIEAREHEGRSVVDLKLQGTALFVDVARLYALAHGSAETNTRARLTAMGHALQAEAHEHESWVSAFEFLQLLRLRVQVDAPPQAPVADNPNLVALDSLNDIDRRMLKESFRVARRLQQRLELDYQR